MAFSIQSFSVRYHSHSMCFTCNLIDLCHSLQQISLIFSLLIIVCSITSSHCEHSLGHYGGHALLYDHYGHHEPYGHHDHYDHGHYDLGHGYHHGYDHYDHGHGYGHHDYDHHGYE